MTLGMSYFVGFLAVSCYGLLGPIAKLVGLNLPPFTFIGISSLILAVCAGIIAFFTERAQVAVSIGGVNWNWMLLFSLINMVGYVLYLYAIRKVPIAQYDMFGIMMPVIGGLFATFLLKEPFHARYIAAIGIMAIGLIVAIGPALKVKQ